MSDKSSKPDFKVIVIMGMLTAVGPLSVDLYLPAFPAIASSLHATIAQVTLSLSSFFIGISAGQLLYGPLLERFGRKKPLYAGLTLFLVGSVGCAFAASVETLIVFRLVQAVGGCAGMVAARAMVRDLFPVSENARIFSLLMLIVSVSPIIAPTLGGYITILLGWRYIFAILILVILIILAGSIFILPESKEPDPTYSLKPAAILRNFGSVLRNPHFITFALTGAISYAGLYAYIGGSPYVFMKLFNVTEAQFGWIFALIAAGLIGAAQVNNLALKRYTGETIIKTASLAQTIIGIVFIIVAFTGINSLIITILLAFFFLACQGFIFPNATALALAPMAKNAGNASALIGGIQMSIGACAAALTGLLQDHTAVPMASIMTGCSALAFIIFITGRKSLIRAQQNILQQQDLEAIESL
jgi:DHA1 family bicyclomycin/chloramphenicol resistance-like MFS transporter